MIGAVCIVHRTDRTLPDVSRRTVIRSTTAGLFALGGVGNAAAHDGNQEDQSAGEDEEETNKSENEEETDDEEGGEEPTANVTFSDQTVANNDHGPTVTVDRLEMDEGGYQSIHRYSRFQFADGEDPEDYDVPIPDELDDPICESLIGITKYLEPGVHTDLEVPLFRSDSPAVELGAEEVGPLDESQVMIAIPHYNTTDEDTFNCPDDPSTPDLFESGDEVDGAFQNGDRDVSDIGISHDLATVLVESDDQEQKGIAKRQEELIRKGVLVPQSIGSDGEAEDESEADDEENQDEEDQVKEEEEGEQEENEDEADEREGKGDEEREDDGQEDDTAKGKTAGESSDRKDESELPKQANDRARDARKDAPGFDE